MKSSKSHLLLLVTLFHAVFLGVNADEDAGWSWSKILESRKPIKAIGNVWPPPPDESADDCLILVSRNQLMWHCPSGNATSYERTVFYRGNPGKYRGAFMGLGSKTEDGKGRRMWLLDSPPGHSDQLLELDTVTGEILQSLQIDDCIDGHDAIVVGNRAFIVDTRHGHVVEIAIPPAAAPFTESSIRAGAEKLKVQNHVNIIKRHTGFNRADHINQVAIHPDLLITNAHGKSGMIKKLSGSEMISPTRLSALDRSISTEEGRELTYEKDGFSVLRDVGTWCHGIAFWEDKSVSPSEIKLISLDSQSGTAVSVVLTGPNTGTREVIWEPDADHPILKPPEGVARAYNNGAKVFSKGLAVQGGVAYFGVSYARAPPLRATVPESLLVAVDLMTKKEIFVRVVKSNGLINQIMTRSNLGDVALPADMSSVELTHHGGGGKMVDYCEDIPGSHDEIQMCKQAYESPVACGSSRARELCCACRGGNRRKELLLAGTLDRESMKVDEDIYATATFVPHHNCRDENFQVKYIPLAVKTSENVPFLTDIDRDLNYFVKHLCNVNVEPFQKLFLEMGEEAFTNEYQHENNNAVIVETTKNLGIKRGCTYMWLVFGFSSKIADKVYHFPLVDKWFPMLQEHILGPLGIPLRNILRMHFAAMPVGSTIDIHRDINTWVQRSHRVHIPIITHDDIFFLAHSGLPRNDTLRIKSKAGEAYEFNNAKGHSVRNLGPLRVHLIIDWMEGYLYNKEIGDTKKLIRLGEKEVCHRLKKQSHLDCGKFVLETEDGFTEKKRDPAMEEL